ncbi:unnamed protein product [Acanthosepion pharaonis]|uniref:Uncharacterized protein n=1 Tax=Acanthosepion pharaonis TaxID=158019 RepID=A0A812B8A8_ACAPH|nr:unnamed protein product [Sepia pharaonis]
MDDPLISLFLHSFAQTHQIDDPLISLVPPFICSNSPSRRPSDIPCSSIHLHSNSPSRRPSDIPSIVPPFICSNSPSRRPSDIPLDNLLFLHSFAQTHQIDDPLISLVPPFICSNSPNRRPSDIPCSSIQPSPRRYPLFLHSFCSNSPNGLVPPPSDILVPPFICSNSSLQVISIYLSIYLSQVFHAYLSNRRCWQMVKTR